MKLSPTPTPYAAVNSAMHLLATSKTNDELSDRVVWLRKLGLDVWGDVIAGTVYTTVHADHGYFADDPNSYEVRAAL